jgi:DNA-binding LytR/AlgR family response regulator
MPDNKKITCLAVDDEPLALDILQRHIAAVPSLELVGVCNTAVEALEKMNKQTVDLMFMDIQMPLITGIDFIRSLKNPPKVIFTTAYRNFAVEGFELNAVDYLMKPISFERFLKAVSKVMEMNLPALESTVKTEDNNKSSDACLYLRADRKTVKVSLEDILYIESLKDYVKVVTVSRSIITKQSISSLEETLPKNNFIRIHRSFIVSLNKVESYNNEVIEIAKTELPISRMYSNEVRKALNA